MSVWENGFLGTRSTFLSDLLVIIVILLIPLFTMGFIMARRHRGSIHRPIMLALYIAVLAYVVVYVIHVLFEGLILEFRDPGSPVYYAYWIIGLIHSFFAVGALYLGWQTVQIGRKLSKNGPNGYYFDASDRPTHAARGRLALIFFAGAALTGIIVYYLLFIW